MGETIKSWVPVLMRNSLHADVYPGTPCFKPLNQKGEPKYAQSHVGGRPQTLGLTIKGLGISCNPSPLQLTSMHTTP